MKKHAFAAFFLLITSFLFADIYFSGFAGAKGDFYSSEEDNFDPALEIQSFFSGQFSLSKNLIMNTEFSLATDDLVKNSIFKESPARFRIDELSLIARQQLPSATNYLSFFVGTYEPIGSDTFLRRQFGIQPIASKITESWLGLSGSIIYPVFGVGGADVIRLNKAPIATGFYFYVNHELEDCYVLNSDLRFAGNYRYFTFDIAGGLGLPLKSNSEQDAFIIVDTIYWRAGTNILIGNAYTTSLFIQAGVSEVKFKKEDEEFKINEDTAYLLVEPRFRTKQSQIHLTLFSLPQETVDDFIFITDTSGVNLNIFSDTLHLSNKTFTFGFNSAFTFPNKNLSDLVSEPEKILDDYTITIAPYITTNFYNGEVHFMLQGRISDLLDEHYGSAFKVNLGYKTQF